MITTFDLDEYVHTAIAAGASGFLLKDTRAEVLADAVRTVAGGEALLAPSILRRLIAHHSTARGTAAEPSHANPGLQQLTERESEVFQLLGRGFSNQEIARELWISESTVKTHVTRLFAKLKLRDRAQAVIVAYESVWYPLAIPVHDGDIAEPPPHMTRRCIVLRRRLRARAIMSASSDVRS